MNSSSLSSNTNVLQIVTRTSTRRSGKTFNKKLIQDYPQNVSRVQAAFSEPVTRQEPSHVPETAYEVVLPVMLHHLKQPQDSNGLARLLDVGPGQAQAWLKRAVEEKRVEKRTKPTRYVAAD